MVFFRACLAGVHMSRSVRRGLSQGETFEEVTARNRNGRFAKPKSIFDRLRKREFSSAGRVRLSVILRTFRFHGPIWIEP
ncbi:unnamed protein product [Nesidiocoris tenuis]|uniref:Uncharacterized protein n=1 Tax=Nesidiocoris tenuis TaxID=355587 RepID=A0A6H5GMN8_9HEMI|nr:unnamed protein product [Nesidiocoris tenuis]